MDSLADLSDSTSRNRVAERIEQLGRKVTETDARIQELEELTSQNTLSDIEFDVMRQLLTVFKNGIDEMTVEQKRAAIRAIVRKVVWDGVNAHVVLFGVQDDEVDIPNISSLGTETDNTEDDADDLESFGDVDYDDDCSEDDCLEKPAPLNESKTHPGTDSK